MAERQGQTAARNILGAREPFDRGAVLLERSITTCAINYVGHAEKWDRVEVRGDAAKQDVAVRFIRDGKLLALATLFRDEESLRTEIEMELGSRSPSARFSQPILRPPCSVPR